MTDTGYLYEYFAENSPQPDTDSPKDGDKEKEE